MSKNDRDSRTCYTFVKSGGTLVPVNQEPPGTGGEVDVSNADIVFHAKHIP